jgi:hypothetical protein
MSYNMRSFVDDEKIIVCGIGTDLLMRYRR